MIISGKHAVPHFSNVTIASASVRENVLEMSKQSVKGLDALMRPTMRILKPRAACNQFIIGVKSGIHVSTK